MKNVENKGFLTTQNAMGRSVPVKTPATFQITNEINGFEHVSYGTALQLLHSPACPTRCRCFKKSQLAIVIVGICLKLQRQGLPPG